MRRSREHELVRRGGGPRAKRLVVVDLLDVGCGKHGIPDRYFIDFSGEKFSGSVAGVRSDKDRHVRGGIVDRSRKCFGALAYSIEIGSDRASVIGHRDVVPGIGTHGGHRYDVVRITRRSTDIVFNLGRGIVQSDHPRQVGAAPGEVLWFDDNGVVAAERARIEPGRDRQISGPQAGLILNGNELICSVEASALTVLSGYPRKDSATG